MSGYADTLSRFQLAVLTQDTENAESLLAGRPEFGPARQIDVYRRGYVERMSRMLRTAYPASKEYLGEAVFRDLAERYVALKISEHFNIDRYPVGFSLFSENAVDGFAAELLQLESAIAEMFLLADSVPLRLGGLDGIDMETFAALRFRMRTALRIVKVAYNSEEWLRAFRRGLEVPGIQEWSGAVCVVRHHNEIMLHCLSEAEYAVLSVLRAGFTVEEALEAPGAETIRDPGALLPTWIRSGYFAAS